MLTLCLERHSECACVCVRERENTSELIGTPKQGKERKEQLKEEREGVNTQTDNNNNNNNKDSTNLAFFFSSKANVS